MRRLDIFQDYGDENLSVGQQSHIGQTFVAGHNNLAGIRFSVSNTNLGGNGEYLLTIRDQNQAVLRSFSIKESNLGWQYTFRYDFAPIADSAGKTYTLELSPVITTASQANLSPTGDNSINASTLKVAYSKADLYPAGYALVNNKPISGDLLFSTYYQVNPAGFLGDSLADFKTRLSADKIFMYGYLIFLTVLSIYLFKRILNKAKV